MTLARIWTAVAFAVTPLLAWAQISSGAPARHAPAISWFTVLCAVAILAVLFGIFRDGRRSRQMHPR